MVGRQLCQSHKSPPQCSQEFVSVKRTEILAACGVVQIGRFDKEWIHPLDQVGQRCAAQATLVCTLVEQNVHCNQHFGCGDPGWSAEPRGVLPKPQSVGEGDVWMSKELLTTKHS